MLRSHHSHAAAAASLRCRTSTMYIAACGAVKIACGVAPTHRIMSTMVTAARQRTRAEPVAVRVSKTPTTSRRASAPTRVTPPEPPQFPTLDTRVLRQGVRGALRAAILNGRLKPGDRIIE